MFTTANHGSWKTPIYVDVNVKYMLSFLGKKIDISEILNLNCHFSVFVFHVFQSAAGFPVDEGLVSLVPSGRVHGRHILMPSDTPARGKRLHPFDHRVWFHLLFLYRLAKQEKFCNLGKHLDACKGRRSLK